MFTTNLAQVSVEAVSASMSDSTDAFVRIPVSTAVAIRPLVESELKTRLQKGHGYYELTKPELVQEYKRSPSSIRPAARSTLATPRAATWACRSGHASR